MNENAFTPKLQAIAKDMRLIFNPRKKLWGIYQVRHSSLLSLDGNPNTKPWLLWDCKNDDGSYRLPDHRDLQRAQISALSSHQLWSKGGDWYIDQIENQEEARVAKQSTDRKDLVMQMAKDAQFHNTVISRRGRDRHNVRSIGA